VFRPKTPKRAKPARGLSFMRLAENAAAAEFLREHAPTTQQQRAITAVVKPLDALTTAFLAMRQHYATLDDPEGVVLLDKLIAEWAAYEATVL